MSVVGKWCMLWSTATAPPGSSCTASQFQCSSADQCVPISYHCDGEVDCQDESDELGCSKLYSYMLILKSSATWMKKLVHGNKWQNEMNYKIQQQQQQQDLFDYDCTGHSDEANCR